MRAPFLPSQPSRGAVLGRRYPPVGVIAVDTCEGRVTRILSRWLSPAAPLPLLGICDPPGPSPCSARVTSGWQGDRVPFPLFSKYSVIYMTFAIYYLF